MQGNRVRPGTRLLHRREWLIQVDQAPLEVQSASSAFGGALHYRILQLQLLLA